MSEPTEIHAWAGSQIDSDSHGDVTLGVRHGPLRADLYTDTLELAFEPQGEHGKAWIAARGCAFAAEMMLSPWTDGAPDPGRATPVAYVGLEGGVQRWGPHGLWGGVHGWGREYVIGPYAPGSTSEPVFRGDLEGGIWTWPFRAAVRAGVHLQPEPSTELGGALFQPHMEGDAHWKPNWRYGPVVDGWGAVASGQGALTLSRVGGLTPYEVPVAGAAWAEWWVQDYAVGRIGVAAGSVGMDGTVVPKVLARGTLAVDVAAFSEPYSTTGGATHNAVGLEASGRLTYKHFYSDLAMGYAPWIPRQVGVSRVSVFFRVGVDWTRVGRKPTYVGGPISI